MSLLEELQKPQVAADGSPLCEGCSLPLHPEAADLPSSSLWSPGQLRFKAELLRVSAERGCRVCTSIQRQLTQRLANFSFSDSEWEYTKWKGFVSVEDSHGIVDGKLKSTGFEIFADVSSTSSKVTPIP